MSTLTYPVLSLVFLLFALVIAVWALLHADKSTRPRPASNLSQNSRGRLLRRWLIPAGVTFLIVAVLTAVFDSVLIGADIIRYDSTLISGIRVGLAPIEDFTYPLAAVLLVLSLWSLLSPPDTSPDNAAATTSHQRSDVTR